MITKFLPAASEFAEGLKKQEENIFDSEILCIKVYTEKNETDESIDHFVVEINQSDGKIKDTPLTLPKKEQEEQRSTLLQEKNLIQN